MAFVLCPDDGLPRVFRYHGTPYTYGGNIVAVLDGDNVLHINKVMFEQMDEINQQRVLTTRYKVTEVDHIGGRPVFKSKEHNNGVPVSRLWEGS